MTAMAPEGDQASTPNEVEVLRGPHGWVNWQAEHRGMPRRKSAHPENIVIHPIWEEFALYTDAKLEGTDLRLGPYEFLINERIQQATLGRAHRMVILRRWDHLFDAPIAPREPRDDDDDYFGGDVGDEMAALVGLALGRRFRSGGLVRQGLPIETLPIGMPDENRHRRPGLELPHRRPMIATVADPSSLKAAEELLTIYPTLEAGDAVALVRSARQYCDGLWLADSDPRLAWIKFVGALEAASNRRDDTRHPDPVAQLKQHRRDIYRILEPGPAEILEAVAEKVSGLFWQEVKVWSFIKAFDPGPPVRRPDPVWQVDWDSLEEAARVIYDHRSRDLHEGIAWPWPLCEPPEMPPNGEIPSECFPAIAVSGKGGQWTRDRLPMYLHVFEHLVGGALRNWWLSLKTD
jgi:hypothetical protein